MRRNPGNSHSISSVLPTAVNILLAVMLVSAAASAAETNYTKDTETGIESWEWREGGVTLQLGQITPGLAQGFYLARGFDAGSADLFAINCAFMAILRNESAPGKLRFNLADWRVAARQQTHPLKLDTEWQKLWANARRAGGGAHRVPLGATSDRTCLRERRLEHGHGQHGAQARRAFRSALPLEGQRNRTVGRPDQYPLRRR